MKKNSLGGYDFDSYSELLSYVNDFYLDVFYECSNKFIPDDEDEEYFVDDCLSEYNREIREQLENIDDDLPF